MATITSLHLDDTDLFDRLGEPTFADPDKTDALAPDVHSPAETDLQIKKARRFTRGVLCCFRARRQLGQPDPTSAPSAAAVLAAAHCIAGLEPADLPKHVRPGLMELTYLIGHLDDDANEQTLRLFARELEDLTARLSEFLDQVFG